LAGELALPVTPPIFIFEKKRRDASLFKDNCQTAQRTEFSPEVSVKIYQSLLRRAV
jgi:hypothetical protein